VHRDIGWKSPILTPPPFVFEWICMKPVLNSDFGQKHLVLQYIVKTVVMRRLMSVRCITVDIPNDCARHPGIGISQWKVGRSLIHPVGTFTTSYQPCYCIRQREFDFYFTYYMPSIDLFGDIFSPSSMAYVLPMLLSFIFLTVPLETSYLRLYWTDLHQILRIGTYIYGRAWSTHFFLSDRPRDVICTVTDFLARIGKNWHTLPLWMGESQRGC